MRNNRISKTYLLQIVQLVIYSIVIVLYLPCNSSAWHTTAMDKQQLGALNRTITQTTILEQSTFAKLAYIYC